MSKSRTRTVRLLADRRFLPLFITQFLGAFNDNLLKSGFSFVLIYQWSQKTFLAPEIIVNLASVLLITPFLLFSPFAGRLADRKDKAQLARIIKSAEIIIMILAMLAFRYQHLSLMLVVVFLMGTQSTFFGPIKYSLLPIHLKRHELIDGNALIESSTFVAILLGTLSGSILALMPEAHLSLSATILVCAFCGWLTSLFIPPAQPISQPDDQQQENTILMIKRYKSLWHCIFLISFFWFFGALLLAQIPAFVKNDLNAQQEQATLLLFMLTVGIAVGALICKKLLTYMPTHRLLYLSSFLMGISFFLFALTPVFSFSSAVFPAMMVFFGSVAGGIYSVPLYTRLQEKCPKPIVARCIATNNVINAGFIILSGIIAIIMLSLAYRITDIFILNACVPIAIAIYLYRCGRDALP